MIISINITSTKGDGNFACQYYPKVEVNIIDNLTIFGQLNGKVSSIWTRACCNSSHSTRIGVVGV